MKSWSIKRKLTFLCVTLMALLVALSIESIYGMIQFNRHLDKISHRDLPAVRAMGIVDMMHDGLRAVVFRALFLSDSQDMEAKKEVAEELKEMSKNINDQLAKIEGLDVDANTKANINKAKPSVEAYVKQCEELVGLALSGQKAEANAKVAAVQDEFEKLEKDLEVLGDQIMDDASRSDKEAVEASSKLTYLNLGLVLIGLIGGIFLSVAIVRDLMKTLTRIIGQLEESSRKLTTSSTQSASSATELSEASTEQAASLQETMASVEQISAMVAQNAESANKVRTAVDVNQTATDDGTNSVVEMARAIGEIRETNDKILGQMEASNTEFAEIVKIITEIGEKTKVINDIVFQTKLLSFNASVEAARAGEHGKGFAVVAEEVGNLAQMSGNAAKQITEMLSDSVKKVNGIVEQTTQRVDQLVEVGKDKISMGESTVQKCKVALEKIADNARTVTKMVGEITNASKEQAQGIQEINKAISQLDQVTQQNTAVAHQSSAQAEDLSREAEALSHAVEQLVELVGSHGDAVVEPPKPVATPKNVISMQAGRAAKESRKLASAKGAMTHKRVSGDSVPSSNDPGFEEL